MLEAYICHQLHLKWDISTSKPNKLVTLNKAKRVKLKVLLRQMVLRRIVGVNKHRMRRFLMTIKKSFNLNTQRSSGTMPKLTQDKIEHSKTNSSIKATMCKSLKKLIKLNLKLET